MNPKEIQLLIVEDNAIYRQAISSGINKQPELSCIGTASNADTALDLLSGISPDVILLDLEMPGIHGIDAIPEILAVSPKSKIIILTQSDRELDVLQAITKGAAGYLLKTATLREISSGIIEVWEGGAIIDPKVAHIALQIIRQAHNKPAQGDTQLLTAKELEVLELLSNGFLKKEIAEQLKISPHSVDKRMRRIYKKLQVQNVASAVASALRLGFI